ncbi:uncharacterized protein LOC131667155 isoform X2 [Phymastichus coffea]|uniref:uncharacterized protein LOC131667155 isoform X2 n=1 Tax=Phymastichus coffea TaxID=108790 RepID=UPI00273BB69C|nr:uncharacterized protein LOC131667155 isoform X2 [Phymastichus coffea]
MAFPFEPVTTADELYKDKAIACDKKLQWYRNTTEKVQQLFEKHYNEYKHFKKSNNLNEDHVATEYRDFERKVKEALDRYHNDASKIYNFSDETARLAFCAKEIQWFRLMDQNLTKIAVNIKKDVLNALDAIGVPKDMKDHLDETLSRIVNFLFIIDMSKNIFKDMYTLFGEATVSARDGIALEHVYQINTDDGLVEEAREMDEEYKEILDETKDQQMIDDQLKMLEDDTNIYIAEEEAFERERENLNELERRASGIEEEPNYLGESVHDPLDIPAVIRV